MVCALQYMHSCEVFAFWYHCLCLHENHHAMKTMHLSHQVKRIRAQHLCRRLNMLRISLDHLEVVLYNFCMAAMSEDWT